MAEISSSILSQTSCYPQIQIFHSIDQFFLYIIDTVSSDAKA